MKQVILTLALALATTTAFAQVGIGTTEPHDTAALDVESTTKGFLPPRMTTIERNDITNPAPGLTIYNTTVNCLQIVNEQRWIDLCDQDATPTGADFNDGFEENGTCTTESISVTSCASVPGASLSASQPHSEGTLYDWTDATNNMSGPTTGSLIEINGQCWFARNTTNAPTAPNPDLPGTGDNIWNTSITGFNGNNEDHWGYHNSSGSGDDGWGTTELATGDGLLYQWPAAMNGETAERSQGVCPSGWHVPSDCEWMYLENNLGMNTITQQQGNQWRDEGDVGTKLSTLTDNGAGTNSSGFTALFAGHRVQNGTYGGRGTQSWFWSSTEDSDTTTVWNRRLDEDQTGVYRFPYGKNRAMSVRCLKD